MNQYTIVIFFCRNFQTYSVYTDIPTFRENRGEGDRIVGTNTETDTLMYGVIRIQYYGGCTYTGRSNIIYDNYTS